MCGRKTLTKSKVDIIQDLSIDEWDDLVEYNPSYNIAPTQIHPIIISEKGKKKVNWMKWGLMPDWSKTDFFVTKMINARQETLSKKPAFRNLINTQRCLIPIDGYFEWKQSGKLKQPYYISNSDHSVFCLAGLWSIWKNQFGESINSYTVITTKADSTLFDIHHRMPVLQQSELYDWLDTSFLFHEFNFSKMSANLNFYPVSTMVNSGQNNSAECIAKSDLNSQGSLF